MQLAWSDMLDLELKTLLLVFVCYKHRWEIFSANMKQSIKLKREKQTKLFRVIWSWAW